jgi:3-hydroxyisobutyrate dehydrogenase
MVGGRPAAVDALRPYFEAMGGHVTHCGGHGTGSAAKLCNTLVLAASMAAVSETLALSRRLGLEFETMTEVLNNSSGRCWSSEAYNPVPGLLPEAPSSRGYKPGMTTDMINEQLQLLIAAAEGAKSPVPVARHVKALYDHINAEGLGDKDFSSIFR